MHHLINEVIDNDLYPTSDKVIFNFQTLRFIEPVGVTILSNLFEWLLRRDVKVSIEHPDVFPTDPKHCLKYLDDSMFFKKYIGHSLSTTATVRSTTIPIQSVAYNTSYNWLNQDFIPWLANQLAISTDSLADIGVCFGEIFNNIRDHANEKIGCIFAQHYPNKDQLMIAISDFGVGIPNAIRTVYPSLTDKEALESALEEGFSSKSTPRNRGAGLQTLLQNVVVNNGGELHIRSYYGTITVQKNNSDDYVVNSNQRSTRYPGTFIEIVLETRNFENIDEEEFTWDF